MLEDCVCSINLKIKGGALEERGQCMRRKGKTSSALVLSRKNTQVLVKKPLFKHSYLKYNQLSTGFNLKVVVRVQKRLTNIKTIYKLEKGVSPNLNKGKTCGDIHRQSLSIEMNWPTVVMFGCPLFLAM